ncbi:uroporphyrinogen-III synthase [Magnetofaba australis]|uniref:Uroporphyrinogen-III synthase n=1 Tax=Magnetofaba australis IT-1 TaxID=1434232 RepID=A0A1Y2K8Q4_9PROT|nr:uroporphyrinogen-III synthase [Magnetofaba australis]OSM07009.1 putative uroporphyrinogen-III synthase [Magnetofaba australis IT-1]
MSADGPLLGKTLLITRPLPEALATQRQAEELGARALLAPMLTIEPPTDPAPLAQAMADLTRFDGIILTSANGARAFLRALPTPMPPLPPCFAVGPKTAAILHSAGIEARAPEGRFSAQALAEQIVQWQGGGKGYLFLRAEQGRDELIDHLRSQGASVTCVAAYRAAATQRLPETVRYALNNNEVDAVLFFSGRTVQSFLAAVGDDGLLKKVTPVCLSPLTAEALAGHNLPAPLIAAHATSEDLLAAIRDHFSPISTPQDLPA